MYLVEFNLTTGPGEPETVEIEKAASYADAVGQALTQRGGVARTLRYVKAGPMGTEMAIMDIRCFKVEDD